MPSTNKVRAMRQTNHGEIMVSSDGRIVWVNSDRCIARFSPVSYEVIKNDMKRCVDVFKDNGKEKIPTIKDWNKFKEDVKNEYNIHITDDHKPYYVK